jgi:hypothetical protein
VGNESRSNCYREIYDCIVMDNKYYVYVHYRNDTNKPFYVGKGKGNRCYYKFNRNQYWKNIVNKANGFYVKIVDLNLEESVAFELEKFMIDFIGFDNLCNLTKGGEGCSGLILSDESKAKISAANKGNKFSAGRILSDEHKAKLIAANKSRILSSESRVKISAAKKGNKCSLGRNVSNETKSKLREVNLGKTLSKETVAKMQAASGKENNPSFKGYIYATNLETGEITKFCGVKELEAAGFSNPKVYACINGKRNKHKGHTFSREIKE